MAGKDHNDICVACKAKEPMKEVGLLAAANEKVREFQRVAGKPRNTLDALNHEGARRSARGWCCGNHANIALDGDLCLRGGSNLAPKVRFKDVHHKVGAETDIIWQTAQHSSDKRI